MLGRLVRAAFLLSEFRIVVSSREFKHSCNQKFTEITEKYEMPLKTYENNYFYPIITEKDVLKYILRQSTTGRILENPKNQKIQRV